MGESGHKRLWYWVEILLVAWEEWSWPEFFAELGGGVVIAYALTHWGIAESSAFKELIWEGIGVAIVVPLFAFLIHLSCTPAKLSRKLEARLEILEEKLRPKFKLDCSPKIGGCMNVILDKKLKIYRLRVESDCASEIKNCRGHLTKIEKDGQEVFNQESLELPFAPAESEDALNKTVFPKIAYYLDILFVTPEIRPVRFAAKGNYPKSAERSFVINQIKDLVFISEGEYILHVSVSGEQVDSVHTKLKFIWKNDPLDSTIEKIS